MSDAQGDTTHRPDPAAEGHPSQAEGEAGADSA